MTTPMKISQLPDAAVLSGTEVIEILQGSPTANKKLLLSLIPGKVWSVNNKSGDITLTATDVGADAAGTASGAISTHTSATDPHTQYLNTVRGDQRYALKSESGVTSINTKTGAVTLTAQDVGADDVGTAQGLMSAHAEADNPHPQYVLRSALDAEFVSMDEVGSANGVASLDETGRVPLAQLPNLPAGRKVTVANETTRLALPVYGDLTIAYQSNDGTTWALDAGAEPSNSALWTPLGSALAGTVNTFKGRSGNVVPEVGDYNADLVTETATRLYTTPVEKAAWSGKVGSVNGKSGSSITLTSADVGAEAAGAAAAAVATHLAAADPHSQYLNNTRGDARYMRLDAILVSKVNGKSGNVTLTATDVGADAAGTASSAISTHSSADDPHSQYLNTVRGDQRYALKSESGVTSINTKTGAVTLTAGDVGAQTTLVSGTNIKTVGGQSLLGSGNIELPGGDVTQTAAQTLTNKTLTAPVVNGATLGGATKYTKTAIASTAIDCSLGNYFTKSVSSNIAFTFSNVPSGAAYIATVKITHTGGTITWPTSVKWSDGVAPELTVGKTHLFVFLTDDGGATWQAGVKQNYA